MNMNINNKINTLTEINVQKKKKKRNQISKQMTK